MKENSRKNDFLSIKLREVNALASDLEKAVKEIEELRNKVKTTENKFTGLGIATIIIGLTQFALSSIINPFLVVSGILTMVFGAYLIS